MKNFDKEIDGIKFKGIISQDENGWGYGVDGSDGSIFGNALLESEEIALAKLNQEISNWMSLDQKTRNKRLLDNQNLREKLQKFK
ncbi:hypothetical protein K9M48_00725 [Candidatus Gracilibacteria bacterium]|nr:hypothetical protein [Candidatus Gracilibacteria bacterium]